VFPARYELNSYIVFRKRLVSKRLRFSGASSLLGRYSIVPSVAIASPTSSPPLSYPRSDSVTNVSSSLSSRDLPPSLLTSAAVGTVRVQPVRCLPSLSELGCIILSRLYAPAVEGNGNVSFCYGCSNDESC
jgi:hypothetical protein